MNWRSKSVIVVMSCLLIVGLSGCRRKQTQKNPKNDFSVALQTDIGGIDDKSFNQLAWEGMQKWGKQNGLVKGRYGFNYYHSTSNSEFATNINQAINDGFKTIIGVGFRFTPAIEEVAKMNPDNKFIVIDDQLGGYDNVTSVSFKDNESGYLAGVAAAKTTKTNSVGFIGGQESETISRFEDGFIAGVKSVSKEIKISVQYVGSFGDAPKAKAQAGAMYASGVDIIYHAAGDSGNGIFSEAIDRMNAGSDEKLWVIGVDKDQEADGAYKKGSVTLLSTLKRVDSVVEDLATKVQEGQFPGGEILTYGLADTGVDVTKGQISDDTHQAIEEAKQAIIANKIKW